MTEDKEHDRVKHQEHLWMVALYEREERTGELLDRLGALGIDTGEATIVRVDLNDAATVAAGMTATGLAAEGARSAVSPIARHAVTGAIIGSSVVLLVGLLLYSASLLSLGFVEGMFGHALVSALAGAALGATIGVLGSLIHRAPPSAAVPDWARLNRDGFLVAIKMPPGLAQQAEEIARRLGAKEILL